MTQQTHRFRHWDDPLPRTPISSRDAAEMAIELSKDGAVEAAIRYAKERSYHEAERKHTPRP